jgi:hypothetical protein
MKTYIQIIFTFCFVLTIQSQNSKSYSLTRSNLGTGGSSKVVKTNNGNYNISQSIGQSSVIGTSSNNGYYLRQGYQQPINKIQVAEESFKNNNLAASVFPNPFEHSVFVSFNENMKQDITVLVFDVAGKEIYSKTFSASQRIELNLGKISSGSYILKVLSNNKLFNAKLIKNN